MPWTRDGVQHVRTFLNNGVRPRLLVGFPGIVCGLVQLLLEAQLSALVLDLRLGRELSVGLRGHVRSVWQCWGRVVWLQGLVATIACPLTFVGLRLINGED